MPELPDLQVFSGNLKKLFLGKAITFAAAHNAAKLNVLTQDFTSAIVGAHISDIVRMGKELFFHFSNGNVASIHLMLNGVFTATTAGKADSIAHKIISLTFADDTALCVSDYQGLAKVTLNPSLTKTPDALSPQFDGAYFTAAAKRYARMNVKSFLIDQKIVKGIGNAYADEILWKADISPECTVGRIPPAALQELYDAIGIMLRDAIENILRLSPDRISGEERSFLRVHNPRRKTSEDGEPILVKDIANKRTYYTAKQRLFF